jgi:hypothetical protein
MEEENDFKLKASDTCDLEGKRKEKENAAEC